MTIENSKLNAMSDDDLFAEIGAALIVDELGGKRITPQELVKVGRAWFHSVLPTIRQTICGHAQLNALLLPEGANEDRNEAIVLLIDSLLVVKFTAVPVLALSYAVTRYGVKRLCAGQ